MVKNHDFVDGTRRCIIAVRTSDHEAEITTEEHTDSQNGFSDCIDIPKKSSKETLI